MKYIILLALVALVGCSGPQKIEQNNNQTATKKLFYMVSPNFTKGPDMSPAVTGNSPEEFFNAITAEDGKAYFLATFTLGGKDGYFLTTATVYTKDGDGMKGWNIIKNRDGKGKAEQNYFSVSNKEKVEMVLDGALYLVATEVPLKATREGIATDELESILKPSFDYLNSLL